MPVNQHNYNYVQITFSAVTLTKHSVISSGPNPQTLTCRVFVHSLFDGKLNAKLSPNLGFDRSEMGFVHPLNEEFEPFGSNAIFTNLKKNSMMKNKIK